MHDITRKRICALLEKKKIYILLYCDLTVISLTQILDSVCSENKYLHRIFVYNNSNNNRVQIAC